jgi:hypothetical protein
MSYACAAHAPVVGRSWRAPARSGRGSLLLPLESAMSHRRDSHPDQFPRLVPLFGGVDKKPRFLDKDVMGVGRARGCDIMLDATEVSAVHCLFYRSPGGFRIRDCGSRTGTRLNGMAVKNAPIADGDVLQVGPFSFEVKLPESQTAPAPIDAERIQRALRSRSNLGRLALQLRRKLRQAPAVFNGLHDHAEDLRAQIRHYDERRVNLEQSERELAAERQRLDQDRETHSRHVHQVEADLAARLGQADEEIHQRWAEFQKRCCAEETRLQALRTTAPTVGDAAPLEDLQNELAERERRLAERETACRGKEREAQQAYEEFERQQQEIGLERAQTAVDIERQKAELHQQQTAVETAERTLREQKAELSRMFQELKRLQDEIRHQPRPDVRPLQLENQQLRQKFAAAEKRLLADAEKLKAELAAQEQFRLAQAGELQLLRDQLAAEQHAAPDADQKELARVQAENDQLRQLLQTQLFKPAKSDDAELRTENEQLRQILTEYEQRLAADSSMSASGDAQQLRAENELLRQLLQEKENAIPAADDALAKQPAGLPDNAREQIESQEKELLRLNDVVAKLELQLREQAAQNAELAAAAPLEEMDLDSLEAELNRERRQIAAERTKLSKEIESLRARNAELDDATRDMEMELSRERAEMARERTRLDRMREEIKNEVERLQRDGGVRESLANVQRLREEMKTAAHIR